MFQHYAVFQHMTVQKNVAFGLKIRKKPKAAVAKRVDELLKLVQLGPFANRLPIQLSGGQRQRVALARALAPRAKVLLLDEPFGALDARVRQGLRRWLRRLHDEVHVTTFLVTHDQEEALELASNVVVMHEGRVEQIGSPEQLYEEPASDFVMGFLGEVTRLNGVNIRPHDIEISTVPSGMAGASAGYVDRILRVGFEVRVTVLTEEGDEVHVVLTKTHARAIGLDADVKVWLTPTKGATVVPGDGGGLILTAAIAGLSWPASAYSGPGRPVWATLA